MLEGKIQKHSIRILELTGREELSYSSNFKITLVSPEEIINPIGQIITIEIWSAYITQWSFLYKNNEYYYQCGFCSKFEFLNRHTKFAIHNDLTPKEIVQAVSPNFKWHFGGGEKCPTIIQYEESDANFIKYLASVNGFAYFELNQDMIFTDKPYLFSEPASFEFSSISTVDPKIINSFSFEMYAPSPISQVYNFNLQNEAFFSGGIGGATYWPEAYDLVETSKRIKRSQDAQCIFFTETTNKGLRVGQGVIITNHELSGKYYVISIMHRYKEGYRNKCMLLKQGEAYTPTYRSLKIPQGLQVATVMSADKTDVKLQFPWSKKIMSVPIVSATAGKNYGALIMPKNGELVVVGFGSATKAFVLGSIYHPLCTPSNTKDYFLRAEDNQDSSEVSMESKHLKIQSKDIKASCSTFMINNRESIIQLSDTLCSIEAQGDSKIIIKHGQSELLISPKEIEISAQCLKISARKIHFNSEAFDLKSGEINMSGDVFSLHTAQKILFNAMTMSLKAQGVSVLAPAVNFFTSDY